MQNTRLKQLPYITEDKKIERKYKKNPMDQGNNK